MAVSVLLYRSVFRAKESSKGDVKLTQTAKTPKTAELKEEVKEEVKLETERPFTEEETKTFEKELEPTYVEEPKEGQLEPLSPAIVYEPEEIKQEPKKVIEEDLPITDTDTPAAYQEPQKEEEKTYQAQEEISGVEKEEIQEESKEEVKEEDEKTLKTNFAIGIGYPYVSLKYGIGDDFAIEAKGAFGSGIKMFAGRFYYYFMHIKSGRLFTALEGGYIDFDDVYDISGKGWEVSAALGIEAFATDWLGVSVDFAPTYINLESSGQDEKGIEYVVSAAVYIYLW